MFTYLRTHYSRTLVQQLIPTYRISLHPLSPRRPRTYPFAHHRALVPTHPRLQVVLRTAELITIHYSNSLPVCSRTEVVLGELQERHLLPQGLLLDLRLWDPLSRMEHRGRGRQVVVIPAPICSRLLSRSYTSYTYTLLHSPSHKCASCLSSPQ